MKKVGIRELKQKTSQILKQVREEGASYEITYHGEAVAHLVPIQAQEPDPAQITAILTSLDQLAIEVSADWPEDVSAVEAVRDVRREL